MLAFRRGVRWLFPCLAIIYFLSLAHVVLWARFATDDVMNLHIYWSQGWAKLLLAQVHFFSTFYRPLGGLFYLAIFEFARLDPFPYRVVLLAFLTVNTWLAYKAAVLLSRSHLIALLAAILTCFHSAQFILYYNTSQLYDVFCFFFWFAAFNFYIARRLRGEALQSRQIALLLLLYICALNSKEMAVTLPVLLVAFEFAYHKKEEWRRAVPAILIVGVATLLFVIGKSVGADALLHNPGYQPVFTVGRFLDTNSHYAAELLYFNTPDIGKAGILGIWTALAYVAARTSKRYLWWALALVILGPTPIAFLTGRGSGCMYIPAFGYALFAASLVNSLARWLSHEPLFRWVRCPPGPARILLLSSAVIWYGSWMQDYVRKSLPLWVQSQDLTWSMTRQMERMRPQLKAGGRILFMNDPFEDWDMHFIAALVLENHQAEITLQRKHSHVLNEEEIRSYDNVLTVEDGRLRLLR